MNANELRIGNWYIDPQDQEQQFEWPAYDWWDWGKCKPIPLTEEWLLRFGFEKFVKRMRNGNVYERTFFRKEESNTTMGVFAQRRKYRAAGFVRFPEIMLCAKKQHIKKGLFKIAKAPNIYIKYVHQLQNLYFALTGEEL